jgi:hypothetical protein
VTLCACGCGQPTRPYSRTRTYKGERQIKGQPAKFVKGHYIGRRGHGRHQMPSKSDAPKCDPRTLSGSVCLALDCRTPMHRQRTKDEPVSRKCHKGHRRHAGRGLCDACRKRKYIELGPVQQPRRSRDETMAEWEHWRDEIRFRHFHEFLGIEYGTWKDLFSKAARAGDPRAVKSLRDRLDDLEVG